MSRKRTGKKQTVNVKSFQECLGNGSALISNICVCFKSVLSQGLCIYMYVNSKEILFLLQNIVS